MDKIELDSNAQEALRLLLTRVLDLTEVMDQISKSTELEPEWKVNTAFELGKLFGQIISEE